jgi:predicted extracellular nuclease
VTVVDNLPANVSSSEGNTIVRSVTNLADRTEIDLSFPVTATESVTVVLNSSYYVTATEFLTPTYGDVVTTFVVSGSLQIHDIKGSGQVSPFLGQELEDIRGVVTMLTTSGFYMQDDVADADPYTSEGIYVYTVSPPSVLVGDDITLSGTVAEYNGMTELIN